MFLHLFVSHSVHKGGDVCLWVLGGSASGCRMGVHPPQAATPPHPHETATEVGGMHPTGMHSCLAIYLPKSIKIKDIGLRGAKILLPPATVVNRCLSVHGGEVDTPIPSGRHPTSRQTPPPKMATVVDGTHPTGMHSCYHLQRSWGKVIFSEACVKNSVHIGDVHGRGMHGKGGVHGRGHAWWGGACVAGGRAWQILRDTVNERAVRILLECILV